MKKNRSQIRRLTALLVAILTMISMMPGITGVAFAEEAKEKVTVDEPLIDEKELEDFANASELTLSDGTPVDPDNIPAVTEEGKGLQLNGTSDGFEADDDKFEAVDDDSANSITVGEKTLCTISAGKTTTFKITPENDTSYIFSSSSSENSSLDPYGRVVVWDDASGRYRQLISDDESGGGDHNFSMSFTAEAGKTYYLQAIEYYNEDAGEFYVTLEEDVFNASISVSLNKSTGVATVTGTAVGDTFYDLYVDGGRVYAGIDGEESFTTTIDMKDYDVGLHTIYATVNEHSQEIYYSKAVATYIYGKPSNKTSYYRTGYNYLIFSYGGNSYTRDYDCGIAFDYRKKGKKWKGIYGPYSTNVKLTKMKSGKTYQVRTYYAKKFTYGDTNYIISGRDTKKFGKTVTIKTGKGKLKVKSLKITKAKQYSRTQTYTTWINIGYGIGYPRTVTYKYWYTDFKITLRLKKKPGAAGVYIGSKRIKGNKKKYTTTMHFSGKKKGKNIKFELCSYQSTKYIGLSKSTYKKAKVK